MRATIRGFEPYNYFKADTNEHKKGVTLYLTCPDGKVFGEKCMKETINSLTSIYKVFEPFIDGDENLDDLVGRPCILDYSVDKSGGHTRASLASVDLLPKAVSDGQ